MAELRPASGTVWLTQRCCGEAVSPAVTVTTGPEGRNLCEEQGQGERNKCKGELENAQQRHKSEELNIFLKTGV